MSCEECCQDCYAYDFENGWCLLWSEFRPPGDVCMGFDWPKPEDR